MDQVKLKDLLEAGCHFGHKIARWNPKMKPYIFTARDGIHIFDLVKTKEGLEAAGEFLKHVVEKDGRVIFVGTKKQAKDLIRLAADKTKMPFVSERWVGGILTNWDYVFKNIENLRRLKADREENAFSELTKKERLMIDRKISRLERIFGGLISLEKMPEAVFIVDIKKEAGVAKEARKMGVKVVAVVDTNSDPDLADLVIPSNDDAAKAINLILDYLTSQIEEASKKGSAGKSEVKEIRPGKSQVEEKPSALPAKEQKKSKDDKASRGKTVKKAKKAVKKEIKPPVKILKKEKEKE